MSKNSPDSVEQEYQFPNGTASRYFIGAWVLLLYLMLVFESHFRGLGSGRNSISKVGKLCKVALLNGTSLREVFNS